MWFYQFFVQILPLGFKILALFHQKTALGLKGRREALAYIKSKFSAHDQVIWMHAASLGEYEQGLPVFLAMKEKYPQYKTLVTFFSPSGYQNVVKKPLLADAVCYLPFDRKKDVEAFLAAFQAKIFFTVKYDFWFNLMQKLKQKSCKIYVVSALFYPEQYFFKPYAKSLVKKLDELVDLFFHQTQKSMDLAQSIGLNKGVLTGDTRYNRVKELYQNKPSMPIIEAFLADEKALIFGSAWPAEVDLAVNLVQESQIKNKIIVAPHELGLSQSIAQKLGHQAVLYSDFVQNPQPEKQVLIIDNIGLLSQIYQYGLLAVVGGGFHSKGLHNILEAATYGQPVLFGNQYRKNPEADELIAQEAARHFETIQQAQEFILKILVDENSRQAMSHKAFQTVHGQPDAVAKIMAHV